MSVGRPTQTDSRNAFQLPGKAACRGDHVQTPNLLLFFSTEKCDEVAAGRPFGIRRTHDSGICEKKPFCRATSNRSHVESFGARPLPEIDNVLPTWRKAWRRLTLCFIRERSLINGCLRRCGRARATR